MTRRSKDWNESLATEMEDLDFARDFILGLLEEGESLQEALGKAIRAYGIKEFSQLANMADSNVLRAIDSKHNPTEKTLSDLLRPFGLRISAQVDVAL